MTDQPRPERPPTAGPGPGAPRTLDVALHLLDRQILDPDGGLVGKVDDLELTGPDDGGRWHVTAVLVGPGALGARFGGRLGAWLTTAHRLLSPGQGPDRIGLEHVKKISDVLTVTRTREQLGVLRAETWVREHVVDRLPGSDVEGQ